MTRGIIHNVSKVAEFEAKNPKMMNVSDEQPTVADLVLPGSGHTFSDEFACLLRVLGGERESA